VQEATAAVAAAAAAASDGSVKNEYNSGSGCETGDCVDGGVGVGAGADTGDEATGAADRARFVAFALHSLAGRVSLFRLRRDLVSFSFCTPGEQAEG